MTRHVLMHPAHEQEDSLRVELNIGRTVRIDAANRCFFGANRKAVNIGGWRFTRYVLAELGPMAGTLMTVSLELAAVD